MAAITGVSPLDSGVQATFDLVRQSLPAVESPEAVLASHQTAVAQLAIEYCNALVESTTLRTNVWGAGFDFTADVVTAFPGPGQNPDPLYDPLLDRLLGAIATPIDTQPDRADVKFELDQLVYGIALDASRPGLAFGGGDQVRTRTIAKSVCSAVVGSAAMLLQ